MYGREINDRDGGQIIMFTNPTSLHELRFMYLKEKFTGGTLSWILKQSSISNFLEAWCGLPNQWSNIMGWGLKIVYLQHYWQAWNVPTFRIIKNVYFQPLQGQLSYSRINSGNQNLETYYLCTFIRQVLKKKEILDAYLGRGQYNSIPFLVAWGNINKKKRSLAEIELKLPDPSRKWSKD